jgi:hemerythrin-like domain-containing protein/uncharacterized protein (DUF2249 family)
MTTSIDVEARRPIGHDVDAHVLADEHAVLLQEVRLRERLVRAALGAGRWPSTEVDGLVTYLRFEVLDQAVAEERLLFSATEQGRADPRIARLVSEHVALRDLTGRLAASGDGSETGDLRQLVELLDDLEELLVRHMRAEEVVLSSATTDGVESRRRPFRCHTWFPVTEGPQVDLDALPRDYADGAALERFSRMRPGERLLLSAGWDLDGLAGLVARAWPREFGWACLEAGPDRWRAEVTRRVAE